MRAKKGLPSFSGRLVSNAGGSRMQHGPYQRQAGSLHLTGGPDDREGNKQGQAMCVLCRHPYAYSLMPWPSYVNTHEKNWEGLVNFVVQ